MIRFVTSIFSWKFYLPLLIIAITSFVIWHNIQINAVKEEVRNAVMYEYTIKLQEENERTKVLIDSTSNKIQLEVNRVQKEKDNEIKTIRSTYDSTIAGLRERITRQEGNRNTSDSSYKGLTGYCTGKELFKDDAEFLAREAAYADETRLELISCYKQYNSVKDNLDQLRTLK